MNRFLGILALLFVACVITILGVVGYFHDRPSLSADVISATIHSIGLLGCTIVACITYILVKYKDK